MASVAGDAPLAAEASVSAREPAAFVTPACRNCETPAPGAFCPQCGQETAIALPTARQFLKEAAGRYVALDGRMWRTLAALLFHPGFLTRAYLAGQRRRYIRPARLFLVLSLLMFAVLRVVIEVPRLVTEEAAAPARGSRDRAAVEAPVAEPPASAAAKIEGPTISIPGLSLRIDDDANMAVEGSGVLVDELRRRLVRFNAMAPQDRSEQLFLGTMRYGPYAMFVLLPAFALLLKLLYTGRRKRHPERPRRYAEHLVYAAHNHAFFFLVVTLAALAPWAPIRWLLAAWAAVYGLWSMKAVYGGSWIGVLARAWLAGIAYLVLFAFVTAGLVLAAVIVR
jgi:hypothetical protein